MMEPADNDIKKEGAQTAQQMVQDIETGTRHPQGRQAYLIPGIAVCWSLFHLSLPSILILTAIHIRTIHLAFAITLTYLSYPTLKHLSPNNPLSFLGKTDRFTWADYCLAITAALCALYFSLDFLGISERQGTPIPRDIVIGIFLVLLLLEAARRALGPSLPLVASCFIFYAFFGPYMPEVIAFKGVSLERCLGQLTLSTEGIYGIPLDVSANIVFLFVLFGAMLEKAGGGEYFVKLAFAMLGRFRGGPAKASVVASAMTGMISGSSIANTVTTGTFTIPLMKKVGYPAHKAAAVEVAASTNGQLTPPIMGAAAFIIAEYTNLEYMEVVKAAIIPAIVAYIGLLYITHLEACKLGMKGLPKSRLPQFWVTFKHGIHYLIPLGFLIYELMVLRYSPQLSVFHAILVLVIIMLFQHPIKALLGVPHFDKPAAPGFQGIKRGAFDLLQALISGGQNMIGIGVATAAAGIIVGVVTMGLGGLINDVIELLSGGRILVMLLITAFACLLLGMGLPTTANYIVMASLTAPVIVTVGANNGFVVPLIAAHLFVFYFGILADDTPPVGLAAFAASAIAKSPPILTGFQGFMYDIRTAILPFMFIFNTQILLIGVDHWSTGLLVFGTCTFGMLAFTSATQNYFITKNKIWETALLFVLTFLFMRPQFFTENLDQHFTYSPKIEAIYQIHEMVTPIIKDFDELSEQLPETRPKFEQLTPLLTPEEVSQLQNVLQITEFTDTAYETAYSRLEFEQGDTQLVLNTIQSFGTPHYWSYLLGLVLYVLLYLTQKYRHERLNELKPL